MARSSPRRDFNRRKPNALVDAKGGAELTRDLTLTDLYGQYRARFLDINPHGPWMHLFYAHSTAPLNAWQLEALPHYNLFFLYGLSCDADLGELSIIKKQLRPEFCDDHLLSPACVTHQMMGFRFMQRRNCGSSGDVGKAIAVLQDKIVAQLTWDIRTVDVYLQRVLMLEDSGATERIKPVWIARILLAQNSDGGWSGFQPLVPLGGKLSIGFSGRGISVDRKRSDFHAAAQGILLMSLLLAHSK